VVNLDSSISFLLYVTTVSSAAAGITEAVKSMVPFLAADYEAKEDRLEDHNEAARLCRLKKVINLLISVVAASLIFSLLHLDPALILAGEPSAYVENPWRMQIWVWGILAVFGSPFFHSLLKILEGLRQTMNTNTPPPKEKRKVSG
jgi:hypothetical protein